MREAWIEFLDAIREAREELGNPLVTWYRGQRNVDWEMLPTLFRESKDLETEQFLFHEFKRLATKLFDKRTGDWEILFDMQHYGLPTRLLDWSEVLGVSLAFTLFEDYREAEDSAVWILDPVALNRKSGQPSIKGESDLSRFDFQAIYWRNDPVAQQLPIALDPPFQSERMLAQKGTFTIHGNDKRALETQCPEFVRKVILPKEAKGGAREFLEHANLNEFSIYPDMVGMARYIRRQALGR